MRAMRCPPGGDEELHRRIGGLEVVGGHVGRVVVGVLGNLDHGDQLLQLLLYLGVGQGV